MTTQPAHSVDAGLAGGVAADGLESTHLGEAGLAAAMAARAAAAADAAGSSIAGIVVLCVSLFENAAIMMRASRFIVSISIAGNSDTPPLVSPAFDETAVRDDATRGTEIVDVAGRARGGGAAATEGRGIFRDCSCLAWTASSIFSA